MADIKKSRELDWHRAHMRVAHIYAELSRAERMKAGCVAVKDKRIISIGINGTPSGWDNVCEFLLHDGTLETKPEVLHAEANCLSHIAMSTESSEGASLYVTHNPCLQCAKMMIQCGIVAVYFCGDYRKKDGLELLHRSDIKVMRVTL